MRIVTWNCYRGDPSSRFDRLASLAPDVAVLQECSKPAKPNTDNLLWFGDNPRKGLAVVSKPGFQLEPGPVNSSILDSKFPVIVTTPQKERIHLLAVWSKPNPTYVSAIARGLDVYSSFLMEAPSVVAGDFNSHSQFDRANEEWTHVRLVQRLTNDFGLASAFHSHHTEMEEPPTLYWRWDENRPFHIDYCFLPATWVDRISEVTIGNFADWKSESDHRPLLVAMDAHK